jgi:BirA family biotin operon repressor/biotin-[acetyl-CoA-carboxylase] ligase
MSDKTTIGDPLIRLEQVDSTNVYAGQLIKNGHAKEGTVILAEYQTHGKGQRGNSWESEKGKNLIFSIILMPEWLEAGRQFLLLMSVSLGMIELLIEEGLKPCIKWPNDIYVSKRKIGGILIEHSLKGQTLTTSVIGIGLNVNQQHFALAGIQATSLALELNRKVDRDKLLRQALKHLGRWIGCLYDGKYDLIRSSYLRHLMNFGEWASYADARGVFKGRITGVQESGELAMEDQKGAVKYYGFKEIEFRP